MNVIETIITEKIKNETNDISTKDNYHSVLVIDLEKDEFIDDPIRCKAIIYNSIILARNNVINYYKSESNRGKYINVFTSKTIADTLPKEHFISSIYDNTNYDNKDQYIYGCTELGIVIIVDNTSSLNYCVASYHENIDTVIDTNEYRGILIKGLK